ncbi:MAG TPA: BrnA antitoxin family protein [Allosphingosinicella sp.]|nr:BrnA antitoxin family protein [Allosphingosinicella sp.]
MSETPTTPVDYDPDDPGSGGYDPDDAPEFTPEMAARAEISIGDKIIREADPPLGTRRGRPPMPEAERKELVSIRLSRDVAKWLRASGPGWQTRIEEMLRAQMAAQPAE